MQRTLIIILAFVILTAIFALQNSAEVVIKLWFWSFDTSLTLIIILTFAAGALIGILFSIPGKKRKKKSGSSENIMQNTLSHEQSTSDNIPLEVNSPGTLNKDGDPEFEDVVR